MATLTLDVPESPRAQAAYRLAADCPAVGRPSCCARTARPQPCLQAERLSRLCLFRTARSPRAGPECRVAHAVQTLATQVAQVQTEARRQVAHAQADAQRHLAAERATLDRTVRQLIALAHPDRWPDTPLAHELTVALVALRKTLQPGAKRVPPARR